MIGVRVGFIAGYEKFIAGGVEVYYETGAV